MENNTHVLCSQDLLHASFGSEVMLLLWVDLKSAFKYCTSYLRWSGEAQWPHLERSGMWGLGHLFYRNRIFHTCHNCTLDSSHSQVHADFVKDITGPVSYVTVSVPLLTRERCLCGKKVS